MNKIISIILAVMLCATCLPNVTASARTIDEIEAYRTEISSLIDECTQAGISTDYEQAALTIIEKFLSDLRDDPRLKEYVIDSCTEVCEKTINDLNAYLAGDKQAKSVPVLAENDVEISGMSFKGTVSENGALYEKPIFLSGVGHWKQVRDDVEFIKNAGFNFVQTEITMNDALREPDPADGWEVMRQINDTTRIMRSDQWSVRGDYSLFISDAQTDWKLNKLTFVHQKVAVKPSTTYNYMFYVQRKAAANFWFSPKGKNIAYRTVLNQTGEDKGRVLIQGTYTTASDETELDITFVNEAGAEYIYIDTVMLYEKGTTANLINNFSFEEQTDPNCKINENVVNELKEFLDRAAENNVMVDVLVSPHTSPSFIHALYPELSYSGWGFFPYDPLMEKSREFLRTYLYGVTEAIKDCTALNSICISNEPSFISCFEPERYNPSWQKWLKEKYVHIEKLNDIYGSDYADFDELDLSMIWDIGSYYAKVPMFNDYKTFNEELFTEWHSWMASVIKEVIPDIYVHAKTLKYIGDEDENHRIRNQIFNGANYELFGTFSDLNGCDSTTILKLEHAQFVSDLHYDLFGSIKRAPIANTENHIAHESSSEAAQNAYSAIWQGAIHGLGASATWIWDKQWDYSWQEEYFYECLAVKPEHLWKLSRATMDINRLSEEIVALQEEEPEIGIVYSETARVYSDSYMNSVYKTYKAVSSLGEKVRLILDTNYDQLDNLKLIIVPDAVSVPDAVFESIKNFDGKLLLIGENSLSKTDQNIRRDASVIAETVKGAEIIEVETDYIQMTSPTVDEIEEIVLKYVAEFDREITITEAETNDISSDISWMATEYQDKKLINVCNYGVNPVKINVTGSSAWKDLISGEVHSKTIVLEPKVPMLLEETDESATVMVDNTTTRLMPVSPILRYRSGYKISWVNPDNGHIEKTSLYKVTESGAQTLISNSFSTEKNAMCSYHMDTAHDDAEYFKIKMDFDNAPSSEIVLGGVLSYSLGNEWRASVNNQSDTSICYQFEVGLTDDAHGGNYALRFAANYDEYDGSYLVVNAQNSQYSVEAGKKYRVSYWMKSNNFSGGDIKPGVLSSKFMIDSWKGRDDFPETRNDWAYYFYDTTAEETAISDGKFMITLDKSADYLSIDDIHIYELNSSNEPIGENLLDAGDFENVDSVDCGTVTNLRLTKDADIVTINWTEPEDDDFASVNLYINGNLSGKLKKGIGSVKLTTLEYGDIVEVKAVDKYGIEGDGTVYTYYPVKVSQNNVEVQELITGQVYNAFSDITVGRLYVACYKGENQLYSVISGDAADGVSFTVPEESTYAKIYLWDEGLKPLINECIWEIK